MQYAWKCFNYRMIELIDEDHDDYEGDPPFNRSTRCRPTRYGTDKPGWDEARRIREEYLRGHGHNCEMDTSGYTDLRQQARDAGQPVDGEEFDDRTCIET